MKWRKRCLLRCAGSQVRDRRLGPFRHEAQPTLLANPRPIDPNDALVRKPF